MKPMKPNKPIRDSLNFKITSNTDGTDIREQCLGLDATRDTFPSDIRDHIHRNRGLHIQIHHNKDAQTFAQAAALSRLIAAAPEMFEALEELLQESSFIHDTKECECGMFVESGTCEHVKAARAIAKARGET